MDGRRRATLWDISARRSRDCSETTAASKKLDLAQFRHRPRLAQYDFALLFAYIDVELTQMFLVSAPQHAILKCINGINGMNGKKMNKNELAIETQRISAFRFKLIINLLTTACKLAAGVAAIWMIMAALREISGANPAGIKALAELAKELHLSTTVGYLLAAGCAGGWALERKGKKRLLPKKAAERHKIERDDAYHPPCGLTPTGDTPKAEEN